MTAVCSVGIQVEGHWFTKRGVFTATPSIGRSEGKQYLVISNLPNGGSWATVCATVMRSVLNSRQMRLKMLRSAMKSWVTAPQQAGSRGAGLVILRLGPKERGAEGAQSLTVEASFGSLSPWHMPPHVQTLHLCNNSRDGFFSCRLVCLSTHHACRRLSVFHHMDGGQGYVH